MNHVELTITELDVRIGTLTRLRDDLQRLLLPGPTVKTPAPADSAPSPAVQKRMVTTLKKLKRKYTKRTAPAAAPSEPVARGGRRLDPSIIARVRKLPEPITVEVLTSNGIFENTKNASNFLNRYALNGWFTRVGRGEYERTRAFGNEDAPVTTSSIDTLAEIKAGLKPTETDH